MDVLFQGIYYQAIIDRLKWNHLSFQKKMIKHLVSFALTIRTKIRIIILSKCPV